MSLAVLKETHTLTKAMEQDLGQGPCIEPQTGLDSLGGGTTSKKMGQCFQVASGNDCCY